MRPIATKSTLKRCHPRGISGRQNNNKLAILKVLGAEQDKPPVNVIKGLANKIEFYNKIEMVYTDLLNLKISSKNVTQRRESAQSNLADLIEDGIVLRSIANKSYQVSEVGKKYFEMLLKWRRGEFLVEKE